ncbi:acetyl/propionyl/methylcrotonyl-CoA carboxylase subunit alpha [Lolliginicoccus levis]|uniref:acetyl/propionyl/methylcrotonyl-CoA carboxylase subunit alpha n=1 Tax=Lolliginicoccus levis TaxID=2919542 RepID=UPI00242018E4|nr:biotin carboxylase N-terminal domain-containing protein [Lolliginicoccus levis]
MPQPSQRFLTTFDEGVGPAVERVLVANRGEIALRVVRTCRDLGITSVAVYAEQDRDSPHVRLADEAYALGAAGAAAYLDASRLVGVARAARADAVHPGYGFLSEDARFAEAVLAAGLVWIGPPPEVIARLGDKVRARELAARVGTPLAPGTPGPVADVEEVTAFVDSHGLPVVIKAAHGGGGRGLKMVHTREEVPEQFAAAVREATAAFGRGECFVERLIERPRHVETQCLADADGTVVVVSTRDCSLQRRSQKLVEEAPAPFLDELTEKVIVESSRALLAAAGYVGAGTCEFLVGVDGTVSFLEVNTRLQVEHPVSEEITGTDLVAEQIRLARGARLYPGDPASHGHAIEFRINAEDAGAGFLPAVGRVAVYQVPMGPGVRVDSGVRHGSEVTSAFDSLLAKVIVVGDSRDHALRRARRALRELEIEGVVTVAPLYEALLDHPDFTAPGGALGIHTRWLEDADLEVSAPPLHPVELPCPDQANPHLDLAVEVDGRRIQVRLPREGVERLLGSADGPSTEPARALSPPPRRRFEPGRAVHQASGEGVEVRAPMNGTVVRLLVVEGDAVEAGQTLAVLEAMKMELPVQSTRAGRVESVQCGPGDAIEAGSLLVRLVTE